MPKSPQYADGMRIDPPPSPRCTRGTSRRRRRRPIRPTIRRACASRIPRIAGDAVQRRVREAHRSVFGSGRETGEHRAGRAQSRDLGVVERGRDRVGVDDGGVRLGPALDARELLHSHRVHPRAVPGRRRRRPSRRSRPACRRAEAASRKHTALSSGSIRAMRSRWTSRTSAARSSPRADGVGELPGVAQPERPVRTTRHRQAPGARGRRASGARRTRRRCPASSSEQVGPPVAVREQPEVHLPAVRQHRDPEVHVRRQRDQRVRLEHPGAEAVERCLSVRGCSCTRG